MATFQGLSKEQCAEACDIMIRCQAFEYTMDGSDPINCRLKDNWVFFGCDELQEGIDLYIKETSGDYKTLIYHSD